LKQFEALSAD